MAVRISLVVFLVGALSSVYLVVFKLIGWSNHNNSGEEEGECKGNNNNGNANNNSPHGWTVLSVLLTGVTVLVTVIAWDINRRLVSSFHSYRGMFDQYIALVGIQFVGARMRKKMDKSTRNFRAVQEELLLKRLKDNSGTAYGKDHSFDKITSREDYVKSHPLIRYDHVKDYIDRLEAGEENILTKDKPVILAVTSGTSGKSNVLPMIKAQTTYFFIHGITIVFNEMLRQFPNVKNLQKSLKLFYTPRWRKSAGGILIGPNSSSPTNSSHMLNLYSTPKPAFEIMTEPDALYVHLLFGLMDKDLGMLEANFASLIYSAFDSLKKHWPDLADDIENGTVNEKLDIPVEVRKSLNAIMTPDPKRAAHIREEFKKGYDGIAKRIWPNMNLLLTVNTGSFDLYGQLLQEETCQGIPIFSPIYAATEGLIGLNIWPEIHVTRYLLIPTSMFYEFIPIENTDESQPKTLFMDQVELNKTYEMVITNMSGMYRYRFGDVVKIVDFYNGCPAVEFLYRQGQLLNVRAEKTSEKTFYQAMTSSVQKWNLEGYVKLVDYCCAESVLVNLLSKNDTDETAPYYTVFLELEGKDEKEVTLTQEQKDLIDSTLQDISYVYRSFRVKGSIGPIKVHLMEPGTFLALRELMINTTGASANQYKVPRVLKKRDAVEFMLKKTNTQ